MESAVPDNIIEDPVGPSSFYVQRISVMSSDYEVFKDPAMKEEKWLVIDQQGSLWGDKCDFVVENYVRPEGGKIGSGECLAKCKLETLSDEVFKYYDMDWDQDVEFKDSDDSDYSSDSGDSDDDMQITTKGKCKFRCKTKATFYADRNCSEKIASCKVKAKGKVKKKKVKRVDGETGDVSYDIDVKKKVKKFIYKLMLKESDEEIPIEIHGSWNKRQKLNWTSDLFDASIEGFWTPKPEIHTKSDEYPAMDLLIGFMVANILSPDDVISAANPPFNF